MFLAHQASLYPLLQYFYYLTDFTRKPMSSTSVRPLRSGNRLDHSVPRVRTALAQCHAFAVTSPSSWNGLPLKAPLTSQYFERRSISVL